jgi:hypothetical protein
MLIARGLADGSLTLPQRKRARQRNKPPVNQLSKNLTPKQNGWWATELIPGTQSKYKRKLPHLTKGGTE